MINVGEETEIGGHWVIRVKERSGMRAQFMCPDCGTTGDSNVFSVGLRGCPGRPESLNYLVVCPGGRECFGHMDTGSPEYRSWRGSSSTSSRKVPRTTCTEPKRAERAINQFLDFARRIGMNVRSWEATTAVFNPNRDSSRIAEFRIWSDLYSLHVDRNGHLTARKEENA